MEVNKIAVIGAGTMGRGIAYAAALGGYCTILEDVSAPVLQQGLAYVRETLEEGIARGKVTPLQKEQALACLGSAGSVEEACREADLVIEAAPEEMELKVDIFCILDKFAKLQEGIASAEDIDKAMRLGLNHPMGPFELVDLVGLDVRLSILEYLHNTLGEKYRPSPLLRQYVKAGRLGRKAGRGVYEYPDAKAKGQA